MSAPILEQRDEKGYTPLHWASFSGDRSLVDALLREVPPETARRLISDNANHGRQSCIHFAALNGHLSLVKRFLSLCPPVLNLPDGEQSTPLIYAALRGQTAVVEWILAQPGVAVDCVDVSGRTPLLMASSVGHFNVVQALLHAGADPRIRDSSGNSPLFWSAEGGFGDVTQLLLPKSDLSGTNEKGRTIFHQCIRGGSPLILDAVLEHSRRMRIDTRETINTPDHAGETPLHFCAARGENLLAEVLLFNGALVNVQDCYGYTALHYAVLLGHVSTALLLLVNGADATIPAANLVTAAHLAARLGEVDLMRTLVTQHSASVNAHTLKEGRTPLMEAVRKGHAALVMPLVKEFGASVDATDTPSATGMTALHYACLEGHEACVKALIEAGAELDALDVAEESPLIKACITGHFHCAKVLLDHGAKPDRMAEYVHRLSIAISDIRLAAALMPPLPDGKDTDDDPGEDDDEVEDDVESDSSNSKQHQSATPSTPPRRAASASVGHPSDGASEHASGPTGGWRSPFKPTDSAQKRRRTERRMARKQFRRIQKALRLDPSKPLVHPSPLLDAIAIRQATASEPEERRSASGQTADAARVPGHDEKVAAVADGRLRQLPMASVIKMPRNNTNALVAAAATAVFLNTSPLRETSGRLSVLEETRKQERLVRGQVGGSSGSVSLSPKKLAFDPPMQQSSGLSAALLLPALSAAQFVSVGTCTSPQIGNVESMASTGTNCSNSPALDEAMPVLDIGAGVRSAGETSPSSTATTMSSSSTTELDASSIPGVVCMGSASSTAKPGTSEMVLRCELDRLIGEEVRLRRLVQQQQQEMLSMLQQKSLPSSSSTAAAAAASSGRFGGPFAVSTQTLGTESAVSKRLKPQKPDAVASSPVSTLCEIFGWISVLLLAAVLLCIYGVSPTTRSPMSLLCDALDL